MKDTGYEGPESFEEPELEITYTLDTVNQMYSRGFPCTVRRNGTASGVIYCHSKEEYLWLKGRIDGKFQVGDVPTEGR